MNRIVEELRTAGWFALATVEEGEPKLRPFSSVAEFEGQVYICTDNRHPVFEQMRRNPRICILAMHGDESWIRLTADARWDNRAAARQAILDDPSGPRESHSVDDGLLEAIRLEVVSCVKFRYGSEPEQLA